MIPSPDSEDDLAVTPTVGAAVWMDNDRDSFLNPVDGSDDWRKQGWDLPTRNNLSQSNEEFPSRQSYGVLSFPLGTMNGDR